MVSNFAFNGRVIDIRVQFKGDAIVTCRLAGKVYEWVPEQRWRHLDNIIIARVP
jgi:hypothetical protein